MSELSKEMFCQANYERALLSYCFVSVENYYIIASAIDSKDFLLPDHEMIWLIIGTLIKRDVPKVDGELVLNEADHNGVLQKIGGYDYIRSIINMDMPKDNIQYYIDKTLNSSTKHQLHNSLSRNMSNTEVDARNEDVTATDMIGNVSSDIMDLSIKSKAVKEATNLSDGLDEYIEERRYNPVEYCGISTGFDILDRQIDGLVPGALHVVCARPKHGKSTFLSAVGAYVAYNLGKPTLYVDTEMPFEQWRARIISMLAIVPERVVTHGGYTDEQYEKICKAAKIINKGKYFHEYMPGYNVEKLIALYKKYKHVEGMEFAIFDYIKVPSGVDFKNKKEYQVLGDVTTALKDLAGELDIPVLCANQINRQDDIADSDRILRYADVLMFFKPKSKEEMDKVYPFEKEYGTHKLIITDSRRGGTTPEEGIGYSFTKRMLHLSEAPKQLIDYNESKKEERNDKSDDPKESF